MAGSTIALIGSHDGPFGENEWLRIAVFEREGRIMVHVRSWLRRETTWRARSAHGVSLDLDTFKLFFPNATALIAARFM